MAFKGTLVVVVVVVVLVATTHASQQQQQQQTKPDLRFLITGSSNSVIVGNLPMFVVSLFALLVGGVIILSTVVGRGGEAGSYQSPSSPGSPHPAYDDIASAIRRLLERGTILYEQRREPTSTSRKGHHPLRVERGTIHYERGTIHYE